MATEPFPSGQHLTKHTVIDPGATMPSRIALLGGGAGIDRGDGGGGTDICVSVEASFHGTGSTCEIARP